MAKMPRTDDSHKLRLDKHDGHWLERMRQLSLTAIGVLLFSVMPAAAMVDTIGSDIGSSGGGTLALIIWFLLMVLLIFKGLGRCYTAIDHMGSLQEDTRRRGREEIKFGGITFGAGLIGVPVAATFVGRILPESWSWMGVDLTQYVSLPGAGATIYIPVTELASGADTTLLVLLSLV